MKLRSLPALLLLLATPVLAQAPLDVGRSVTRIERALESGDHDGARALIQDALERDRKSRPIWALRRRWAEAVGDTDEVVYCAHRELQLAEAQRAPKAEVTALRTRVLELDPLAADLFAMKDEFRERLLDLAKDSEKDDRPHAAIRAYKRLLSLDPEHQASRDAIERIAARPDPSLAGDAKPKDLFADVSREWMDAFDAEHADWKKRGKLERENYVTHTDAGYEIMIRSAEAMEQMNAFYRRFFRYGTKEDGGSVPRIELRIFQDRDEYLALGTGPPAEWSGGQFTGSAVETYVGDGGFQQMVGTLFHEAAHQFVSLSTNATGWLNEGLASFFEGTRILANGTVVMNMPADHRLFPLASRMEEGWMRSHDDGFEEGNPNATPRTAPTFRIVLEDRYTWGPPWYAPTWGVVYFLYNYQDMVDGRFVYRAAFQEFIDASGGRMGEGAVGNFEEVVLANPSKPYKGVDAPGQLDGDSLPRTVEDLDALWKEWILALRDEQQGKLEVERDYANWGRYAAANGDPAAAREHFEKGIALADDDPAMRLDFAALLADEFDDDDRAAKLASEALRMLEARPEPDAKAIRAAEKVLAKYDPDRDTLTELQDELAATARSLVARYRAAGRDLMVMELAWRLGTDLDLPDLFDSYRDAVARTGRTLSIWELAYDETSLDGWNTNPQGSFRASGATIDAKKGAYDPENFDYEFLTLDRVTSGDFSLEAEVQATRGKVTMCGFVFGQKAEDSFHALALFPGSLEKKEGVAGTGFVELFSFYGGQPKTWQRAPVDTEVASDRSATARWHTLRLDVSGRDVDLWCDGRFLATQSFPSRDVLAGRFGLFMGSGEARFRRVRFLARDPRDPAAAIERELRLAELRAASGGSLDGSFVDVKPPFPLVGRWAQGERASWDDAGSVPQLLVFFSIVQNDLIPVDAWLRDLATRGQQIGLEIVCVASANDDAALDAWLASHALPGAVCVDRRLDVGVGDTFELYSIPRYNLPRLILLDVDGSVAWEGDPGFQQGRPWTPGMRSTLDDPLERLEEERSLLELMRWKGRWAEARPRLARGELGDVLETLRAARDLDPRFSEEVALATGWLEAIEAAVAALESTAESLAREEAEPALQALLTWAQALELEVPKKAEKALKPYLRGGNVKQWEKAERALERLGKKKDPDADDVRGVLTELEAGTGATVREAERVLRDAFGEGDAAAALAALPRVQRAPAEWLARHFFRFSVE